MNIALKQLSEKYFVAKTPKLDKCLLDKLRTNSKEFWTISESSEEISIVSNIGEHATFTSLEGPWTAFRIIGQLDFSLTGILAKCSTILADAKISVFAISTFDTDYFLVREESHAEAISAWKTGGIVIS